MSKKLNLCLLAFSAVVGPFATPDVKEGDILSATDFASAFYLFCIVLALLLIYLMVEDFRCEQTVKWNRPALDNPISFYGQPIHNFWMMALTLWLMALGSVIFRSLSADLRDTDYALLLVIGSSFYIASWIGVVLFKKRLV